VSERFPKFGASAPVLFVEHFLSFIKANFCFLLATSQTFGCDVNIKWLLSLDTDAFKLMLYEAEISSFYSELIFILQ